MEERARRIVVAAIELAEKGGFEGVRLRDVAAHADVALGTLYRRFRSKEDLLLAALEHQMGTLEQRIDAQPLAGVAAFDRVQSFFRLTTEGMCARPHLARALVRPAERSRAARERGTRARLVRFALGLGERAPRRRGDRRRHLQCGGPDPGRIGARRCRRRFRLAAP
jgi:AcrR family transcriptional regulator